MKPGTRFKLECVVAENSAYMDGLSVVAGSANLCAVRYLQEKAGAFIFDIREPRRRFTDVDGTEYEVLEDGDKWENGDMMHNQATGVREEALFGVGSKVLVGPDYKLGLRKVKP